MNTNNNNSNADYDNIKKIIAVCDGGCINNGKMGRESLPYGSFKIFISESFEASIEDVLKYCLGEDLGGISLLYHMDRIPYNNMLNSRIYTNNGAEILTMWMCIDTIIKYIRKKNLNSSNNQNNLNMFLPFIEIYSDSKLIINQVKGIYKVNNPFLKKWRLIIYNNIKDLYPSHLKLEWLNNKDVKIILGH